MNTEIKRSLEGCIFETSYDAAPLVVGQVASSLPSRVDLRPFCSPIEDQEQTNSCTANAVVGALEYHQRRSGLPLTDLSRLFTYYNARQLANTEEVDCGSQIHHAMASVLAHGVCDERIWPFMPHLCTVRPSAQAYADATRHQAIQYGRAPLGDATMSAVAAGIPVVFGTRIPSAFYQIAQQTGAMPMPGPIRQASAGGHAMLIVGYDRNEQIWIVRNSYGVSFGERGYMRIPFKTLSAYSMPVDFWTIGAIETNGISLKQNAIPNADFDAPSHLDIDIKKIRAEIRQTLESGIAKASSTFHDRLRS